MWDGWNSRGLVAGDPEPESVELALQLGDADQRSALTFLGLHQPESERSPFGLIGDLALTEDVDVLLEADDLALHHLDDTIGGLRDQIGRLGFRSPADRPRTDRDRHGSTDQTERERDP